MANHHVNNLAGMRDDHRVRAAHKYLRILDQIDLLRWLQLAGLVVRDHDYRRTLWQLRRESWRVGKIVDSLDARGTRYDQEKDE